MRDSHPTGSDEHPPRLLIVDDDLLAQGRVRRVIQAARPSWELLRAETVDAALRELAAWGSVDVVLSGELGGDCVDLLESVQTRFPTTVRIAHLAPDSPTAGSAAATAHAIVTTDAPTERLVQALDRAISGRPRPPRTASGVHRSATSRGTKRTTG